jgi:acyl-CoA synthetase (NDP forming)
MKKGNTAVRTYRADLDKLFRPRRVAIIGASPDPNSPRNRLVKTLLKHGFDGQVYPVAPSHSEVEGFKAYKSIADLPEVPDLAQIITPAATVPAIIGECAQKGIHAAIVYSSGFEETPGGKDHARKLAEAAEMNRVAVLGPNGQGLWSVRAKTMLTFGAAAFTLPSVRHAPIAVISQSGALAGAMGGYLQKNGLGCAYIVSVGNETCLDALDVLDWIIRQDDVRVVVLYLEGLKNGGRLSRLAAQARERGVQIVALKAGRSAFGQEATASHTGKIASPYAIYLNVLEQFGVIVVESLTDAMAAVEVLSASPDPRQSTDSKGGISIMSSSGGAGALLADHGEENKLPMAEFGPSTLQALKAILPEFARIANPVDLTGQIRSDPNLFRNAIAALGADPHTEAIVVQFASSGLRDLMDNAESFKEAARSNGVPLIITFAAEVVDTAIKQEFLAAGIILSPDPSFTMKALRWLYDRRRYAKVEAAPQLAGTERRKPPFSWEETMAFLADSGVPAARWRILGPTDSASRACKDLDWPLVVKVLPSEAEHKTELGLVKLRVRTPEEVDAHAASFRQSLGKADMDVLVQEMITDGVEVVLASLRNTDFGPVLSIGSGGVAIELFRDVTYLSLPVTSAQVETALRKLKLWRLLEGFRGAPRADVTALVKAAVRFGEIVLSTPDLLETEINPVLVRPDGKGVAAVDFLGTVARPVT